MEKKSINNYLLIADCDEKEIFDFKRALVEKTEFTWESKVCPSNQERTFISNLKRLFSYLSVGFSLFLKRKNFKIIICWQQFFGIFYSFFCNLFFIKNSRKVVVMTFIYREKAGLIGFLYRKFINFSLKNDNILFLTTSSKNEGDKYSSLFNVDIKKFKFLQWSRDESPYFNQIEKGNYLVSIGRSNRDFDFIEESLKNYEKKTFIYSDIIKKHEINNVIYTGTVAGADIALAKCFCVIISVLDPSVSAGQTLLINAMSLKKPIIATYSKGLTDDYIKNKVNGIVITKSKDELLNALRYLDNESNYNSISKNAFESRKENYSIYKMGERMVELMNEKGLL